MMHGQEKSALSFEQKEVEQAERFSGSKIFKSEQ